MNRSFTLAVSASMSIMILTSTGVARAESPGFSGQPACGPAAYEEKAGAIELLRADAQAARQQVRFLIKGAAATLYRMKVVELDELIERLRSGDAVSYQEVDEAMEHPARFIGGSP